MTVETYLLIATDGYSIESTKYDTKEDAIKAMKDAYNQKMPEENIYADDCWISDEGAFLSANGENVYVWDIRHISLEVDTSKAHAEFVTEFMYNELTGFDFDGIEVDDDTIKDLASAAYDRYCEGNGETEYECIEAVYYEYLEELRGESDADEDEYEEEDEE